jgi:hypothetical protein
MVSGTYVELVTDIASMDDEFFRFLNWDEYFVGDVEPSKFRDSAQSRDQTLNF